MLNYDVATGDSQEFDNTATYPRVELGENPFPGLRPFNIKESHLFFGREGQVDEILLKLSQHRFITVIGYSGSGKSSLMNCGLIPVLYGGFMASEGSNWTVITTRPGNSPYENLAESLIKHQDNPTVLTEVDKEMNLAAVSSILKSGAHGLVEAIKHYHIKSGNNIFLLIDQFEELFRYADMEDSGHSQEDAASYVQMVLEALNQTEVPIFLALTLRSDYIGRCANFAGLTEKINDSNYLVPQMARDQKKLVIEGPVAVGGGAITQRLVKRLLNDVSDHQDQLPILQHAMMRTWEYWVEHQDNNEPIDLRHYQAVGGISEALSQHADVAYEQLDQRQKEIAEILFKTLTLKTSDNQGIRRAAKISVVADISGATPEEVIEVVEEFRRPGRSFLMPPPQVNLIGESNIEISHESLMRIWTRLKVWVDEEFESAQMYKRLSDAAAMYQIGKTGLWRPPDLQLALNWQKKQRPTRAWAQRYDEAFERAIVFLDTSRITYEAEQKNQEMVQKRLLRRTRVVAVVLGAAAVISILFFVYAVTQSLAATRDAELARRNEIQAKENFEQARTAENLAERRNEQLAEANTSLEILNEKLEDSTILLMTQRENLQRLLNDLQIAEKKAVDEAREANIQSQRAQESEAVAQQNYQKANTLTGLFVAQSMAIKSQFIEDADLRSIVAQQAYVFHKDNGGRMNDPYIYSALHDAVDRQKNGEYNSHVISQNAIRSVEFTNNFIYATGSEGQLLKLNREDPSKFKVLVSNTYPHRFARLSADNQWLVLASDSSFLQIINTQTENISRIRGHKGFIRDIAYLPNSSSFYSLGSDGDIRLNDPATGESTLFKKIDFPAKSIEIHPGGNIIALGTDDSRVFLLDVITKKVNNIITKGKNNPAHALAFHRDGELLAIGYEKGMVDLYDLNKSSIIKELYGHVSSVSSIEFSPDGKYLASGSFDKTIYLWTLNELDELPTILEDHDGFIWDIDFSRDSNYLIAGMGSGKIKIWPVRPELMADIICQLVFMNMTPDQWKLYVGTEIDYQRTCPNLP